MSRHFGGGTARQSDRPKVILFLCVLFLLLFTALAYLLLRPSGETTDTGTVVIEDAPPQLAMKEVLIPLRTVEAGQGLQQSMFRVEERLSSAVPERAVRNFEQIRGYFARTLIVPGVPLQMDYVTNVRPISAISSAIPAGFRAVTIRVDDTASVEGWALPGSKVDVVWASKVRGQPGITTIVQNAKVLSADRQVQANPGGGPVPSTVTLLVSAKDAQKIQLASTTGSLSLSLRGDAESGKAVSGGTITVSDLFGGSRSRGPVLSRNKGTVTVDGKKWIVNADGSLTPVGQPGGP